MPESVCKEPMYVDLTYQVEVHRPCLDVQCSALLTIRTTLGHHGHVKGLARATPVTTTPYDRLLFNKLETLGYLR
jgi:hypothetical protein